MDELRPCSACGALLVGPFDPGIDLAVQPALDEADEGDTRVTAWAWICPACGLVTWYVADQDLGKLPEAESAQEASPKPDVSYERRNQMMRMLRRVRRM